MEVIKNLIEKLGTPSSDRVGVYISSDSKIEVSYYNIITQEIYAVEKTELQYNQVLREVNLAEFESTLLFLLNKMEVPTNCPICICLPHILTSIKSMPSDLEDLEIELALSSEAEKSYIFKKTEPKPSWAFLSENTANLTHKYLYSVLQKKQTEKIGEILDKNGLKLLCIDVSFTSLLRGLECSGVLSENIENHFKWCLIIISANNYVIAKFEGENILNVIENPLALRSIEPEVLYPTLNSTISEKLQHEELSNIYLVSQTQEFVAEKLASHIKLMSKIHTIDNNKFNNNPLFISSKPSVEPISPESIGVACWENSKINLNLNFADKSAKTEIHGVLGQIGLKKPIHLYLLGGIIASLLTIILLSLSLWGLSAFLSSQIYHHSIKINELKRLNITPDKKFNAKNVFYSTYVKNQDLLTSYDAIGAVIPEKLWVDSFFIDSELNVRIKGKSYNVDDIITYFENLQKTAKFKNLKIKNIEIISEVESNNEMNIDASPRKNYREDNLNESNRYTTRRGFGEDDLSLPPPPMPRAEKDSEQNYYKFVFENYELMKGKKDSFLDNLPDFAKNVLFGN